MAYRYDDGADERIVPGVRPASPKSGKRPLTRMRRLGLAFAACACAALVAVSSAFLFTPPQDLQDGPAGAAASVDQADASGVKADKKGLGKGGRSENAQESQPVQDAQEASAGSGSSQSSSGGKAGSDAPDVPSEGVAPGGSFADGGQPSQQPAPVPSTVTVRVSVSSAAVGNPVSASATLTFQEGATVYDALCGMGLSINSSATAYGIYVAAIGGLAEKEHGAMSGWTYYVNGAYANKSSSAYVLSDGDSISWVYVTG